MRARSQERDQAQTEQENAAQQTLDKAILHTLKPSDGVFYAEGCLEEGSDGGFNAEGCQEEEAVSPRDEPETSPLDEPKTPLSTDPEPDRPSRDRGSRSKDGGVSGLGLGTGSLGAHAILKPNTREAQGQTGRLGKYAVK